MAATDIAPRDEGVRTTDGAIALRNLSAQVAGLSWQVGQPNSTVAVQVQLVELFTLRGHVLGRVADAERAAVLAEQLACDEPADGSALLARARMRAHFHRFQEASIDLDRAEQLGADATQVDGERAAIFQVTGREDQAMALCQAAVARGETFETLGALAGLYAERGETAAAERLFDASRARYQRVSPFPLAQLDLQRGRMWQRQGEQRRARGWFEAATCRLPAYAPAQGSLAAIEAALGDTEAAIARLRPLTVSADDPGYAAKLAGILMDAGQESEAKTWRAFAASRYEELVARHPEAWSHYVAEFWMTIDDDPRRR